MSNNKEEKLFDFLRRLSEYLECKDLVKYFDEINGKSEIILDMENSVKDEPFFETKKFEIFDFRLFRIVNYVLVREFKPNVFIETGVMHGLTSQFLLHAITRNQSGKLISIDYPSYYETGPSNKDGYMETLPPKREPGWAVLEKYKPNWELLIGKSVDKLPEVFEQHPVIDIFLHDSEHTYETMWNELTMSWDKIKNGGLLICDNIDNNTSFFDFCRKINQTPFVCPQDVSDNNSKIRFGIVKHK